MATVFVNKACLPALSRHGLDGAVGYSLALTVRGSAMMILLRRFLPAGYRTFHAQTG